MKTLDDWLASSESEEDERSGGSFVAESGLPQTTHSSQVPHVSLAGLANSAGNARSSAAAASPTSSVHSSTTWRQSAAPVATARTGRLEETRAKMSRLLGQEAVNRALSSSSLDSSQAAPTARAANVPSDAAPTSGHDAAAHFAAAVGTVGGTTPSPASPSHPLPGGQGLPPGSSLTQTQAQPPPYVPVEVMVVDRGTQTVTTVGVQTDPEPPLAAAPPGMLLQPGYHGGAPAYPVSMGYGYGYGASTCCTVPFTVDGRPYRQQLHQLERTQAKDAAALREQLETIQNSIDMLIARYSLPPPPQ